MSEQSRTYTRRSKRKDDTAPYNIPPSCTKVESSAQREQENVRREVRENCKHVLIIDDHYDSAFTIKSVLEDYGTSETDVSDLKSKFHPIRTTVYVDPILALLEFKPYYYDLALVDIDMPGVGGFELAEKIIKLDPKLKICFMSTGEINYRAMREIQNLPKIFDCYVRKAVYSNDSINRVLQELLEG